MCEDVWSVVTRDLLLGEPLDHAMDQQLGQAKDGAQRQFAPGLLCVFLFTHFTSFGREDVSVACRAA